MRKSTHDDCPGLIKDYRIHIEPHNCHYNGRKIVDSRKDEVISFEKYAWQSEATIHDLIAKSRLQ